MKTIPASILRQLFFIALLMLLGGVIFVKMIPFLTGVLGAITLYILLIGIMKKMLARKWWPSLAALTLMLCSFLCIILPFTAVILMLWPKVVTGFKNYHKYFQIIEQKLTLWGNHLGIDPSSLMDTSKLSTTITEGFKGLAGNSLSVLISIGVMYFALYFMLTQYKAFNATLIQYAPFKNEHISIIGEEVTSKVRSNAIGIPLVAVGQGIVSLIGFFIFGIDHPFFWAAIISVASVIPMVGGFIGFIPIFLISLNNGDSFQAWGILIYSLVVVGATDYAIRVLALKKLGDVHPLITVFGVLIGLPLFGFLGLIFGPLLLSLVILLVDLYTQEYGRNSKNSEKQESKTS